MQDVHVLGLIEILYHLNSMLKKKELLITEKQTLISLQL